MANSDGSKIVDWKWCSVLCGWLRTLVLLPSDRKLKEYTVIRTLGQGNLSRLAQASAVRKTDTCIMDKRVQTLYLLFSQLTCRKCQEIFVPLRNTTLKANWAHYLVTLCLIGPTLFRWLVAGLSPQRLGVNPRPVPPRAV